MKTQLKYLIPLTWLLLMISTSCNKLIEIPESKNQVESSAVFTDSTLAASALLSAYFNLGTASTSAYGRMKFLSLYTDEYSYTSSNAVVAQFSQGKLAADNSDNAVLWNTLYSVIYQCNSVLEGLSSSKQISGNAKQSLMAEAQFLRAFCNFYLVTIYEHIPLILTTAVNENRQAKQSTQSDVFRQIISDLQQAKTDLFTTYTGSGRVRANKWAASALLARVYWYQQDWISAAREASEIIESGIYIPLPEVTKTFLATSKENIFAFWTKDGFLSDATQIIPASNSTLPQFALREGLSETYDNTDTRKTNWLGMTTVTTGGIPKTYYYLAKYRNRVANSTSPEYSIAFRAAEQYLIRAEALAWLDNTSAAIADLNKIRLRAALSPLPPDLSREQCLDAIARERKKELLGEWGLRFIDLKRIGKLDEVIKIIKPGWTTGTSSRLPIPQTEIVYNSNLIQNNGY